MVMKPVRAAIRWLQRYLLPNPVPGEVQLMRQVLTHHANCIDVGANEGSMLAEMVRLAPRGRHLAFEPIPHLAANLRRLFPSVQIFNMALSDAEGHAGFHHFTRYEGFSGLRRRDIGFPTTEVEIIEIATDTLDNIVPANLKIDFLKIDVEGAELLVMKGGRNLLRRDKPIIVFEHGIGGADLYNVTPEEVFDFINDNCEMQCALLQDWSPSVPALSRDEFVRHFSGRTHYMFVAWDRTAP